MGKPLISVIIPTYNRSQLIGETLISILSQTYTHWECLIVDDGSTDNTLEVAKKIVGKDSRFSVYNRPDERPKGANACRNYGFHLSEGDFILFLDSDDVLKSTCLEKRLSVFNKSDNLDFVIANSSYIKDGIYYSKPICEFPEDYSSENYLKLFLSYKLPWTIMSVLWKKEVIRNFKFDEGLKRFQDIDYHITILSKKTYRIKRLNEVDTYYRVEDKKVLNQNHINSVISSLNYFLNKHIQQEYIQNRYPGVFKNFIIFFLLNYLYPNYKDYMTDIHAIETIIKTAGIFNTKEQYLLKALKLLAANGLKQKKGLGINRVNKLLKKSLKYE